MDAFRVNIMYSPQTKEFFPFYSLNFFFSLLGLRRFLLV